MTEYQHATALYAKPGPINTDRTLSLVSEKAKLLRINTVLIATSTGTTALRASELIQVPNLIAVTHSAGFKQPFDAELDATLRQAIEANGVTILTTTHAFGGVGRAVRKKLATYQVDEIIAYTLRTFGQGMKVAAEITIMAADAGFINDPSPIIAVGGSGRGADTAAVILPTHAQTFFDLRYLEIICMPAAEHPAFAKQS
ncbi:MAG: pyruvate kinase alpha/beta domain-containing protein [Anaerolineae bacterium]|nr:pyruvate kinase alpha/beta domain-containing protein [Anaerolineae bacterium]